MLQIAADQTNKGYSCRIFKILTLASTLHIGSSMTNDNMFNKRIMGKFSIVFELQIY